MPQLNYDDMSAISYIGSDIAVSLTPDQQSLAIQALALFTSRIMWQDWNANQALIDELVAETILALDTAMPDTFGNTALFFTAEFNSALVGGAIAFTQDTTCFHNGIWSHSGAAQNDVTVTPYFYLKAGEYEVTVVVRKGAGSAIMYTNFNSVAHGDSILGNDDLYNAGGTLPNTKIVHTGTIPDDGMYRIKLVAPSKNAASAGYTMAVQSFLIRRTGD